MRLKNKTKQTNDTNMLLNRLLISLSILIFIRMGLFLPVPGINPDQLNFYFDRHSMTKQIFRSFAGNDTIIIGLFTLNIFPYINASIILQLLINFFPNLKKLQNEGGVESRRQLNKLLRTITLIWAIIQSFSIAYYVRRALFDWNFMLAIQITLCLTTGAMIVLWLSEIITEYGLGNGPSLLVYINIVSSLPNFLKFSNQQSFKISYWILSFLCFFISLYGIILLQEAVRKIPLLSSRQLNQISLSSLKLEKTYNYLPLRYNQAGIMPIILTTAVLVFPTYFYNLGLFNKLIPLVTFPVLFSSYKLLYWIFYFILIIFFSLFYSTIVFNPKDISYELQKRAVAIPGLRPGIETTFYLKCVMRRVTLIGAILLALLTTTPNIISVLFSITDFNNLGTTSLLILVGVILDLTREIRSIILSNIYNEMFN